MLLKCPECNGQVSDKATACPHCGAPVKTGKLPSGIFGIVGRWLAEKREKALEKELHEQERLDKLNAEKKAEQERQAKLEYKRNFSYSSKPYWESCYDGLDCAKIRKDLCSAASYQDVLQALSPFKLAQDGYFANLPWLKEWASLDPGTRTLDVLYVAFCMSDQTTCDSLIKAGYVLNKDVVCKALVKLAAKNVDERTLAFIDRYVDFSTDNLSYYQSHIRWLPILDSKPDIIPFYTRFGIDKPLRAKQDYYRGVVDEKDTNYEKNVDHIRRWLSTLPQRG